MQPCVASCQGAHSSGVAPGAAASTAMGVPLFDDVEGARVPSVEATAGEVVDAHVHLFPDRVFEAIWRWFDQNAWPIRYRLHAEHVIEFMRARGVAAIVGLHYSHRPGMARALNEFARDLGSAHRDFVLPLGTVLPGEPGARDIVREALGPMRLRGIKLHCHVQKMPADDPRIDEVYSACADAGRPVVIHAGRAPASAAYGVDTYALCGVDQVERVLQRHPTLRLVVPHLGADEFEPYAALLDRYEHLFLDTTMAVSGAFATSPPAGLVQRSAKRLLYGTDFPNIPYAWDRELRRLCEEPLSAEAKGHVFSANARALFGG